MKIINPLIKTAELHQFEQRMNDYRIGKISSQRFVGERLLMGIYGQRQQGMMMVRTKLPGGHIHPYQLEGLATALEGYSAATSLHITTRQDIQLYSVTLNNTAPLLHHLAEYDLSTREAGGNTIRNITSCPYAGVCPQQYVDVTPYIEQVALHFNYHPLTQALPRKVKLSFSGCGHDCANGLVQDLGFIATTQDGAHGFKVIVGGGLGATPIEGVVLEPFIVETDLIPVIEAVVALHDHHSDRERRSRSRLKFILQHWGRDKFISHYQQELKRTLAAYDATRAYRGDWLTALKAEQSPPLTQPLKEHQSDRLALPVSVPQGNLTVKQLRELAQRLTQFGIARLKLTQKQGLILFGVEPTQLEQLSLALKQIGLEPASHSVGNCPGSVTCPLGITDSKSIAIALGKNRYKLDIVVNGCQNGCANANIADIGLSGRAVRHHKKLVPSYTLHLGGSGAAHGALAHNGPNIPAQRVIDAVARIEQRYRQERQPHDSFFDWSRAKESGYFDELLADLIEVKPDEIETLIREHGDSQIFRVQRALIGECAGNSSNPVDKLLLESSYELGMAKAFAIKAKWKDAAQSLEQVLIISARARLISLGLIDVLHDLNSLESLQSLVKGDSRKLFLEIQKLSEKLAIMVTAADELSYPPMAQELYGWHENNRSSIRSIQAQAIGALARSPA